MKIAPSNVLDLVLGYFSSTYVMYYNLPENQKIALDIIFQTLQANANKFKSKFGKIPTLFIDGIDELAKHKEGLFVHLVTHAKRLANAGILSIVLVSSEGSILPIIQRLSGVSRCSKIFEVTDITDEEAIGYLQINGVSQQITKKLVDFVGGRFIYLVNTIILHEINKNVYPGINDESVYLSVMDDLFSRKINNQQCVIVINGPTSINILSKISKEGHLYPAELLKTCQSYEEREKVLNTIKSLVDANILRYTSTGSLTWHGKPQQHNFQDLAS